MCKCRASTHVTTHPLINPAAGRQGPSSPAFVPSNGSAPPASLPMWTFPRPLEVHHASSSSGRSNAVELPPLAAPTFDLLRSAHHVSSAWEGTPDVPGLPCDPAAERRRTRALVGLKNPSRLRPHIHPPGLQRCLHRGGRRGLQPGLLRLLRNGRHTELPQEGEHSRVFCSSSRSWPASVVSLAAGRRRDGGSWCVPAHSCLACRRRM